MVYSFFITQWFKPSKGDWTEQVKEDLSDFEIPCNLSYIEAKSTFSFKNLVKQKAKKFTLKYLLRKKAKHRKMDNLKYSELKMQSYFLKSYDNYQKTTIFKFRTRMAQFSEKFFVAAKRA